MNASLETDRFAILRVIEGETAAYFNKDYDAWAQYWVHTTYVRRLGWYQRGGKLINVGWEEEAAEMRLSMQRYPNVNRSVSGIRRENISIEVRGDVAWAIFDQVSPSTGDAFDVPGRQNEVRILEREQGEWRIACCFVLGSSIELVTSPLLQVDEKSRILWINEAAIEQLKHHRGLAQTGGRLRALNRTDDQRLKASIRWAAGLKAYTDRQTARSLVPAKYGALPVLVGDETSPEVCWVIADGGMILVSFNDEQTTGHRLDAAAVIYGITPAQMRLARLIVEGSDMVAAAHRLGVSNNTARTQLKRMFDKTGVTSQAALVRTLLSVVSPLA